MSFNVGDCKVVHFGSNNLKFKYCMNNTNLDCVDDKDLVVVVSSSLEPSKQCALAASNVNMMLGLIRMIFSLEGKLSLICTSS